MSESRRGFFLRALERRGIAIGPRRWTRIAAAGFGDDPDPEELEEDLERSLSKRSMTAAVTKGRPLSMVILAPGGIRHHRGGEPAQTAPAAPEAEAIGKEKAPRDSAASLRRKIRKIQRDIAKLESKK